MKFVKILALATVLATPAFAAGVNDHTGGGNAVEVARASYRTADDSEALANQARFSCGGSGYQLSASANRLHLAVSDLYHAARRASGGGRSPQDHREGEFGQYMLTVDSAYRQVQQDYSFARCDFSVQRLYQAVQYDYSYLDQVVDGQTL